MVSEQWDQQATFINIPNTPSLLTIEQLNQCEPVIRETLQWFQSIPDICFCVAGLSKDSLPSYITQYNLLQYKDLFTASTRPLCHDTFAERVLDALFEKGMIETCDSCENIPQAIHKYVLLSLREILSSSVAPLVTVFSSASGHSATSKGYRRQTTQAAIDALHNRPSSSRNPTGHSRGSSAALKALQVHQLLIHAQIKTNYSCHKFVYACYFLVQRQFVSDVTYSMILRSNCLRAF